MEWRRGQAWGGDGSGAVRCGAGVVRCGAVRVRAGQGRAGRGRAGWWAPSAPRAGWSLTEVSTSPTSSSPLCAASPCSCATQRRALLRVKEGGALLVLPCRARLQGSSAGLLCRATLQGYSAGLVCRATLQGYSAGLVCRARLQGSSAGASAGLVCRARLLAWGGQTAHLQRTNDGPSPDLAAVRVGDRQAQRRLRARLAQHDLQPPLRRLRLLAEARAAQQQAEE